MKKWSKPIALIVILVLVFLLPRPILVALELIVAPPTSLQVTLRQDGGVSESGAIAIPPVPPGTYNFPISPAVLKLYYVMRTRLEIEPVGGCRLGSNITYHVTFMRGGIPVSDASLNSDCNWFSLGENDEWYVLHRTNRSSYFAGAYSADEFLKESFADATQLPYSPP